jgi:hypothetical protein
MAPRDRKHSGLEILALIVAFLSLAVSGLAVVLGYAAWKRPLPPDPTDIPSFEKVNKENKEDNYETIDGTRFVRFLEEKLTPQGLHHCQYR